MATVQNSRAFSTLDPTAVRTLQIAEETVEPGTTRDLQLKFSESYLGSAVTVPLRVIRSDKEGPIVFMTGSIHGDELTGVGNVRELLYDQPPVLKRGSLVCIPVVNTYGLENQSRYLPDHRDLT